MARSRTPTGVTPDTTRRGSVGSGRGPRAGRRSPEPPLAAGPGLGGRVTTGNAVELAEATYREFTVAVVLNAHVAAGLLGIQILDLEALNLLEISGSMAAGELATRLGLPTATTTRVIDRLEEAELVRRERDPDDRRRVIVTLQDTTTARTEETFAPANERLLAVRDQFTAAELTSFLHMLDAARAALRAATIEMRTQRADRRTRD